MASVIKLSIYIYRSDPVKRNVWGTLSNMASVIKLSIYIYRSDPVKRNVWGTLTDPLIWGDSVV